MAESEVIYQQFKKFNEIKNFHHWSLLQSEMKRVTYFGKDFIKPERVDLNCSVMGWKLLKILQIYPKDEDYYRFLKNIGEIEEI